ncbi:MAG TPA: CDP-alcohol phosphatidyltransferase family protein [Polyangiaceae bacterium]|nr:CDP-alcohol phosphatidyltransferase family protein [Polyangiaceae bacterium]
MAESAGFWSGYWQSLKSLDVEEPVDLYVHRPLAYVLARALLPTPVSPNAVTLASMALSLYAAFLVVWPSTPHHFQWAALCCFLGTVFDCADGQLARMRKTSSVIGRMLDGTADVLGLSAILIAGTYHNYLKYSSTWWHTLLIVAFSLLVAVLTSIQTTLFDHYKTVFMKLGVPGFKEAESYPEVRRRYEAQTSFTPVTRLAWLLYLQFVGNQSRTVRKFDPHTVTEFSILGEYQPERAQIYREHAGAVMGTWRRWFGYGSLMMGISIALAFEVLEYYMLLRVTVYVLAFYGPLRSRQRQASQAAFAALGVEPR